MGNRHLIILFTTVLSHWVIPFRKIFVAENVPLAENAKNDGRRQAQPLREYLFFVLTLQEIIIYLT